MCDIPTRIRSLAVFAECLAVWLACRNQRRLTGNGSALEAIRDDALHRSTYFFTVFFVCCQPMQTSLVLMIFLRLFEDVMTLQTVPTQRRRDILTTLTTVMPSLFPCFVQTLRTNLELYRAQVSSPSHCCILATY